MLRILQGERKHSVEATAGERVDQKALERRPLVLQRELKLLVGNVVTVRIELCSEQLACNSRVLDFALQASSSKSNIGSRTHLKLHVGLVRITLLIRFEHESGVCSVQKTNY